MTAPLRYALFAFVLGAALAAAVLLGRPAQATGGTIEACFKPSNGTLYLLGGGSGRSVCQPGDIPISWNTAGVNGQDGVSVTSDALDPGEDAACPNGGSKFTSVSGDTYACNGTNGQDGIDGQDGEDFAGSFTSPNGLFSLDVDNAGARIEGPTGRIVLDNSNNLTLNATTRLNLNAPLLTLTGGALTSVNGPVIHLNGGSCGVLRHVDIAAAVGPDGGPVLLFPGSPTVRTAC